MTPHNQRLITIDAVLYAELEAYASTATQRPCSANVGIVTLPRLKVGEFFFHPSGLLTRIATNE